MIAIERTTRHSKVSQQTADAFEALLPTIKRFASHSFRHAPRWSREELISDTVAKAYVAYVNLVARGQAALAYPSALAKFAVRHVRAGRVVGSRRNVRDVLSRHGQHKHGFAVLSLPQQNAPNDWEELVEDRKASPADIAACRVDFRDWLRRLLKIKRQIALRLAAGDTTTDAAQRFGLSLARVSQLRRELRQDWDQFQAVPGAA